jgi:DNA-binding transcriptional regulator YbjK
MSYEIESLLIPYMNDKDKKKIEHYMSNTEQSLKQRCESSFTDMATLKKKVEG